MGQRENSNRQAQLDDEKERGQGRMEDRSPSAPDISGDPPLRDGYPGPDGFPPEGPPPGGPPFDGPPPNGLHPPDGTHPPDGMRPPPNFLIHLPEMGEYGPPGLEPPRLLRHFQAESVLPDGTKLTLDAPQRLSRFFTPSFAAYIAAVIAVGMIGSIWSVSLATKPLSRLSAAADRFGADVHAAPIAETGPREVKHAAVNLCMKDAGHGWRLALAGPVQGGGLTTFMKPFFAGKPTPRTPPALSNRD